METRRRKYGRADRMAAWLRMWRGWVVRGWREVAWHASVALRTPGLARQQAANEERAYLEKKKLSEEYARGYLCGWHECFEACVEAIEEEIGGLEEGLLDAPAEAAEAARADAALLAAVRAGRASSRALRRMSEARAARLRERTPKPN